MMQAEHRRESTSGESFFMDFFVIYSFLVAASLIEQQSFQRRMAEKNPSMRFYNIIKFHTSPTSERKH